MSKNYKQKHTIDNEGNTIEENNNGLSKKEIYDLKQKEKKAIKEKLAKKNKSKTKKVKKKSKNKTYSTNLAGRIFAIIMLLLMAGSVITTVFYYFNGIY